VTTGPPIGHIVVNGGVRLRADPARDDRFRVVNDQQDMATLVPYSEEGQRELLHTSFNEEIQSLEIAAQELVDFPEAPWELQLRFARQCWDETRHARIYLRRLLAIGGRLGEFPIINQEWGAVCSFDSLAARLAVQNRTFEGGSLDVLRQTVDFWISCQDNESAAATEVVLTDEIGHAAIGTTWLKLLAAHDPLTILQAVTALSRVRRMAVVLAPPDEALHDIAVNTADRALAGFTAMQAQDGPR
jgi:uncharacterized ferritin-like protein (DUF455 family)